MIIGFTGRANPDLPREQSGPKYVNTPTTLLFHKGDQLYQPLPPTSPEAVPVLTEGPLDAIAVTLATGGRFTGYAPLGTALTETQAERLSQVSHAPIVCTDNDTAGRAAAARDYWLLALHHADALEANLPDRTDPADLLANGESALLSAALQDAQPLADSVIQQRLATGRGPAGILGAIQVLAARPPETWTPGLEGLAQHSGLPVELLQQALYQHVQAWNADPRRTAQVGASWRPSDQREATAQPSPSSTWRSIERQPQPPLR